MSLNLTVHGLMSVYYTDGIDGVIRRFKGVTISDPHTTRPCRRHSSHGSAHRRGKVRGPAARGRSPSSDDLLHSLPDILKDCDSRAVRLIADRQPHGINAGIDHRIAAAAESATPA